MTKTNPAIAPLPLRDALIDAGIALLIEGGAANLTLRRAAARVGVSHAAPAHHFEGLPGLMTAMATRAFELFATAMIKARDQAGPDPRARLHAICKGYLAFASDYTGLFHLMFIETNIRRTDPAFMASANLSYATLRDCCAPFIDTGPREELEIAVWSLVHGYALLGLQQPDSYKRQAIADIPPFAPLLEKLLPPAPRNPLAPPAHIG